ncbi:MAG TPA: hypothetical protein DD670_13300, partial [Planctomycetaceae bacterium]|nr:hypothetical protein [Planctomycetaceae bacterium]
MSSYSVECEGQLDSESPTDGGVWSLRHFLAALQTDRSPMPDRYFVETRVTGSRALLTGNEARHLARVMRARKGDRVVLFDGTCHEYLAEVVELRRDEVELEVLDVVEVDRELPFRLHLAVALPKGDRQRWLVEKL